MYNFVELSAQFFECLIAILCFVFLFLSTSRVTFKIFAFIMGISYIPTFTLRLFMMNFFIQEGSIDKYFNLIVVFEAMTVLRILNCLWFLFFLFLKGYIRIKGKD